MLQGNLLYQDSFEYILRNGFARVGLIIVGKESKIRQTDLLCPDPKGNLRMFYYDFYSYNNDLITFSKKDQHPKY